MVNTSIDVPRHLLLTDDGKEPDDWAEARAAAIRNARERYRDLGYSDLKERKRGLDERIAEQKSALERLENAIEFYELALRTASKRADRHGTESHIVEALSPATAEDGWTLDIAAGWGDEEPERRGAEWKPSPELLTSEGVDPDSPHVPRSLTYSPDATWRDVLRDLRESVEMEQKNAAKRDLDELEFLRSVLDSVMAEKERGMDEQAPSDESDEVDVADVTARAATSTQLRHLKTARAVLEENPEIGTRADFEAECDNRGEPGGSVRKRVQKLGKDRLNTVHLPSHYTGFDGGFQQLVKDLWADSLVE